MMPTEREILAYDIRRDAEYVRRRLAERSAPDSPTLPTILGAAQHFGLWCEAASDELVNNPAVDVDQVREMWRHEAVASDIRFIPHGDLAALACLGGGALAVIFALAGFASGSISSWFCVAVLGAISMVAFGYRRWMPSRLAVGPDAQHATVTALSVREILSFGGVPQRRRYQLIPARSRVRS